MLPYDIAVVMNLITYEKAYCMYLAVTFLKRMSLICRPGDSPGNVVWLDNAHDKYHAKRWRVLSAEDPVASCHDLAAFYPGLHNLHDRHTWSLSFNTDKVGKPMAVTRWSSTMSHEAIDCSAWQLAVRGMGAEVGYQVVSLRYLYHQYVMCHILENIEGWYERYDEGEYILEDGSQLPLQ